MFLMPHLVTRWRCSDYINFDILNNSIQDDVYVIHLSRVSQELLIM